MSNCLFWALRQWWERGGYIIARRSHYGWWPHFLWSEDLETLEQFHPHGDKEQGKYPPCLFHGHVKIGKDETREEARINRAFRRWYKPIYEL